MSGNEIRTKRNAGGIVGHVLCRKVSISRNRLSELERGYVAPERDELERLDAALDELIKAKRRMEQFAAEAGWPMAAGVGL